MNREKLQQILHKRGIHNEDIEDEILDLYLVRQRFIAYTEWLTKQNLMISEGVDGYTFRSSMTGGKKYTPEELYEKFESEYVA
jgi:hypothetical protein